MKINKENIRKLNQKKHIKVDKDYLKFHKYICDIDDYLEPYIKIYKNETGEKSRLASLFVQTYHTMSLVTYNKHKNKIVPNMKLINAFNDWIKNNDIEFVLEAQWDLINHPYWIGNDYNSIYDEADEGAIQQYKSICIELLINNNINIPEYAIEWNNREIEFGKILEEYHTEEYCIGKSLLDFYHFEDCDANDELFDN